MQGQNRWPSLWHTFFAISKVPWVTALAAWGTGGTYTSGSHFVSETELVVRGISYGQPGHGEFRGTLADRAFEGAWPVPRSLGWEIVGEYDVHDRSISKAIRDDLNSKVVYRKPQPNGGWTLFLKPQVVGDMKGVFAIESFETGTIDLADAQWADWDHQNRLLMATNGGHLQIHNMRQWPHSLICDVDLNGMKPTLTRSPPWAQAW